MGLRQEQSAFLLDVVSLINWGIAAGFEFTFGEAHRTLEQQQLHVKAGRSKTLQSKHMERLAIDLNVFRGGKLCGREEMIPLGRYWESLHPNNRWGGSWRGLVEAGKSSFIDCPHFERNV